MSTKKSSQRKRPSPPKSKNTNGSNSNSPHRKWSRWTVWVTGAVSALVIAAATAFGSGIGDHLFSIATRVGASSHAPVKIESVSYISYHPSSFAYPGVLTKEQVLDLTSGPGYYSDGVPRDFDQYMNTVAKYGGTPIGNSLVQVVMRGDSSQSVVITGIQVIKHCSPPLTGTLIDPGGGGSTNNIMIGFNLDQPFSYAQFWDSGSGRFYDSYFAARTIVLHPGELDTIVMNAETARQFCRFSFNFLIDDGTRQVTENVNRHGQDFVVTAITYPPDSGLKSFIKFSDFKEIYTGGVTIPNPQGPYLKVNPKTFNGSVGP